MGKTKIEPKVIITFSTNNLYNIPIIVTDKLGNLLDLASVSKTCYNQHNVRKMVVETIAYFSKKYEANTLLMEENQLFIDKIDRYPDPCVLYNVKLGYGIAIAVQDVFYEKIDYILEIPKSEWRRSVLNNKVEYAIDLYKAHILRNIDLSEDILKRVKTFNCYEVMCFAECLMDSKFLNIKYQINK